MIRLKLVNIIWDERNEEHIKKHNVTKSEVELAIKRDASSKERQNYYEFEKNKENNV